MSGDMPTVPLADVCFAAVQDAHAKLLLVAQRLGPRLADADRRAELQRYLAHARGLLLRLLVIVRWAGRGMARLQGWSDALTQAELQSSALRRAADDLYFLHEAALRLKLKTAPAH